ncbi:MAG: oxidoreductase [Alphaproteobacteria bacterium]|nr:oxidoreductase [Alphaproteobacteria bacterium]
MLCLFFLLSGAAARADQTLARPTGPVILTVTGAIGVTNAPGRAEFDRAMLEGLGMKTIDTSTSWTSGKHEFAGPLGQAVLAAVGAKGGNLSFVAVNEYKVQIPASDFEHYPAILALKMDGEYMTVRTKGPLWVIYPRDQFPELVAKANDAKWIWQVKSIDVY